MEKERNQRVSDQITNLMIEKIIDDRTATTEESSKPFARKGMDFKANRTKGSTEEIAFRKNLENLIAKSLVLPL